MVHPLLVFRNSSGGGVVRRSSKLFQTCNRSSLTTSNNRMLGTIVGVSQKQQKQQQQQQQHYHNDTVSFNYNKNYNNNNTTANKNYRFFSSTSSKSSATMQEAEYLSKERQQQNKKETMEYQAETRQLLDIVTHSLYTDKEVFLRELISNASDSLEKLRHLSQTGDGENFVTSLESLPLEIRIETDEMNQTLTISDTGIGMTRDDMISNLGTIAKSGSKEFVKNLNKKHIAEQRSVKDTDAAASDIIGKFGVGFYSSFMVGDKVQVRSKSAIMTKPTKTEDDKKKKEEMDKIFIEDNKDDIDNNNNKAQLWSSTGVGTYDISDLSDEIRQNRGSSIVIHLKNDCIQYSDEKTIEGILKKYSNFVGFPIYLNGNKVNMVEALWTQDPKSITQETYDEFYKYIAKSVYHDEPLDKLHYKADVPIDIKALFFIPSFHSEKYGMGRMEPGVSLYSRKVLIENKCKDILPDWLRFIKGVVDSEDLPLSISREKAQDTALIAKLRKAITRKIITHLTTMSKKRPDVYKHEFYKEYSFFLKEGICQDYDFQEPISKLLYYETNKGMNKDLSSLDEYISRCKPNQKDIYYLCAPTRTVALQSPYLEAFNKANIEVIFVYSAIDDFVMANLEKYEGRNLISADKSDIQLPGINSNKEDNDNKKDEGDEDNKDKKKDDVAAIGLKEDEAKEFCTWFQQTIGEDKVVKCIVTDRLSTSPAVVTDNESGAMRRMMRMVDTSPDADGGRETDGVPFQKQIVEINKDHPLIVHINSVRNVEPTLAKVCAEQIFDNCLVSAGILDDSRSMIPRLNDILLAVVKGADPSFVKK